MKAYTLAALFEYRLTPAGEEGKLPVIWLAIPAIGYVVYKMNWPFSRWAGSSFTGISSKSGSYENKAASFCKGWLMLLLLVLNIDGMPIVG